MADIFALLLAEQQISEATAGMVQRFCHKWSVSGFHGLLETNVFEEIKLADTLARLLKLDRVYNLASFEAGSTARQLVSYEQASQGEWLPNQMTSAGRLELVVADPTQSERFADLQKLVACPINLVVGTRSEIVRAIDDYYPLEEQLPFLRRD